MNIPVIPSPSALSDADLAGVYRLPSDPAGADALLSVWRKAAAELSFHIFRLDLAKVRDKKTLFAACIPALALPSYFGANWDALEEALNDLSWQPAPGYLLVLEHGDGFRRAAPDDCATLIDILRAAADGWRGERIPFWSLTDLPESAVPAASSTV